LLGSRTAFRPTNARDRDRLRVLDSRAFAADFGGVGFRLERLDMCHEESWEKITKPISPRAGKMFRVRQREISIGDNPPRKNSALASQSKITLWNRARQFLTTC
jgi:hypothetical protein